MIWDAADSSSDAYVALCDHLAKSQSLYQQNVSRQLLDGSRRIVEATASIQYSASVGCTLLFNRDNTVECLVPVGLIGPASIALSESDIRYLAAVDTELNKIVSMHLAERLLNHVSRFGVLWIEPSDREASMAA